MPDMTPLMVSFHAELTKQALMPGVTQLGSRVLGMGRKLVANPRVYGGLSGIGGGAGAGGVIGAAGGAALGGYKGYQEAQDAGATRGGALRHAVGRGLSGAAKGAVLGAETGAVTGGILGATGRGKVLTDLAQRSGALGIGTRFGQRQVYGVTGATPQGFLHRGGLEAMRGGTWEATKRMNAAKEGLELSKKTPAKVGLLDRVRSRSPEKVRQMQAAGAEKEFRAAKAGLRSSDDATRMGLTSLPGYAAAIRREGPVKAISTGAREQWHGTGAAGKALIFGLPAVTAGKEMMTKTEPGGPGKVERTLGRVGDLAYSLGPIPIAGQLALAGGIGAAGRQVSKGLSKMRGKQHNVPAPPQLEPAGGEVAPAENIGSERLSGLPGYTS